MVFESLPIATILLLCSLHDVINASDDFHPIVDTDKGKVQGHSEVVSGNRVDKFLGIPFARPPLDDLRFKPPAQLDPWEGVRDATSLPNSCMQLKDTFFGDFYGSTMWNANTPVSEDCLYLSVWVPKTQNSPSNKNKAVIVFIYGGSFLSGSHTLDIYNPHHLVTENDVILVGIQYRVGSLGFLAMDTSDAPGNAGLWDQRMGLDWVSRNIHNFGGNPHSVTLVSESAGSASVGLHLLCDVCNSLFHRAILQSGAPDATWAVVSKEEMWKRSERLAKNLNCYKEGDPNYMVECMRNENSIRFLLNEYVTAGITQFPFVPIVDGVFLRQHPTELIRRGMFKKVPLLLGSNNNEITFFLAYHDPQAFNASSQTCEISGEKYRELLPSLFEFYPHHPHRLNQFGHDAIHYHYTHWLDPEDKVAFRQSLDKAASDAYFVCPVNRLARSYSRHDLPVYYYWFDQRWSANPWPEWMGVLHGDELWFSFGQALNQTHAFTPEERELSRSIMRYWTNFAKTGDPNQAPGEASTNEWPRFHFDEQKYINLSVNAMASGQLWGQEPRTQHCAFWDFYLPQLVAKTSEVQRSREEELESWKKEYIKGWKTKFDDFIHNYQPSTAATSPPCQSQNDNTESER